LAKIKQQLLKSTESSKMPSTSSTKKITSELNSEQELQKRKNERKKRVKTMNYWFRKILPKMQKK